MTNENNISPDIDCPSCGGEGLDADPYGRFDYDCIIACPDFHTIQPTQSDALREENERLRALLARTVNLAEVYAEGTGTNFKEAMAEARAALQEQSK